jgi:hypothetical protein
MYRHFIRERMFILQNSIVHLEQLSSPLHSLIRASSAAETPAEASQGSSTKEELCDPLFSERF